MATINRRPQLKNIASVLVQIESGGVPVSNTGFSTATDGIFAYNVDYKVSPETMKREGSRSDISPMGVRTGRKTASVSFSTELRSEGSNTASSSLGKLLRLCGYEEVSTQTASASARTILPVKHSDNTGTNVTWGGESGTPVDTITGRALLSDYRIKCTKAGASSVAKVRVTGGILDFATDGSYAGDYTIGQSEVVSGWVENASSSGTFTVVVDADAGDYEAPTFTFSGTPETGDVVNMVILGRDITYTVLSGDTKTPAAIASIIERCINGVPVCYNAAGTKVSGYVTQGGDIMFATANSGVITISFVDNTYEKTIVIPNGTHTSNYNDGESIDVYMYGTRFHYEAPADATTPAQMATALAALIDADTTRFDAAANTATITVTPKSGYKPNSASVAITTATSTAYSDGTDLALGRSGITVTPFFSGSLALGDQWMTAVCPQGYYYKPVSQNMATGSIKVHLDGVSHRLTNAMGTFTFDAKAGSTGVMNFTFTSNYNDPVEEDAPEVQVNELPAPIFELAYFAYNHYPHFAAENFTFDQGNEVTIRPNYNADEGYYGIIVTSRSPSGSFDPESARISEVNMWTPFANSTYAPMRIRFGTDVGNTVWLYAPATQVSDNSYGDRNNILTISTKLNFSRAGGGNNEVYFVIC